MTTINWALIGVIGIIVLCGWKGKKAGFIKSVFSMVSVILALVGAVLIGPVVRSILSNSKTLMETLGNGNESIRAIVLNALSFIAAYIVARIAVFIICTAMDIVAKLPILHQMNEMAGLLIGIVEGLLNVWIGFVVLNIFCDTSWGKILLEMINGSPLLTALYENNLLYIIWDLL